MASYVFGSDVFLITLVYKRVRPFCLCMQCLVTCNILNIITPECKSRRSRVIFFVLPPPGTQTWRHSWVVRSSALHSGSRRQQRLGLSWYAFGFAKRLKAVQGQKEKTDLVQCYYCTMWLLFQVWGSVRMYVSSAYFSNIPIFSPCTPVICGPGLLSRYSDSLRSGCPGI